MTLHLWITFASHPQINTDSPQAVLQTKRFPPGIRSRNKIKWHDESTHGAGFVIIKFQGIHRRLTGNEGMTQRLHFFN